MQILTVRMPKTRVLLMRPAIPPRDPTCSLPFESRYCRRSKKSETTTTCQSDVHVVFVLHGNLMRLPLRSEQSTDVTSSYHTVGNGIPVEFSGSTFTRSFRWLDPEMSAPILFCHYGNSRYLRYVLEMARFSNPDKQIVLLGDEKNAWLADQIDIEHRHFREFDYGEKLNQFHRHYRPIQGRKHGHMKGGQDWLKFVFARWFFVLNFIRSSSVDEFWHFDSDNMILAPLSDHEDELRQYDCTEQCNGLCINGFVSSVSLIERYVGKINACFQDESFLQKKQKELDKSAPHDAFNEMIAYGLFKQEESVNAVRLNAVRNSSTFDECICQNHHIQMERLFSGKLIKRIHSSPNGKFFCQSEDDGQFLRLNSINCSWVPVELFEVILQRAKLAESNELDPPDLSIGDLPTLSELLWESHYWFCWFGKLRNSTKKWRHLGLWK